MGLPAASLGYETDQITNRSDPIADSTEVLNREVNHTITEIVDEWQKGHDEMAFVNQIFRKIGGQWHFQGGMVTPVGDQW